MVAMDCTLKKSQWRLTLILPATASWNPSETAYSPQSYYCVTLIIGHEITVLECYIVKCLGYCLLAYNNANSYELRKLGVVNKARKEHVSIDWMVGKTKLSKWGRLTWPVAHPCPSESVVGCGIQPHSHQHNNKYHQIR